MRTKEALAARKAEGLKLGRKEGYCPKYAVLEENENLIQGMIEKGCTHRQIYSKFKVSKSTFYKFYREFKI